MAPTEFKQVHMLDDEVSAWCKAQGKTFRIDYSEGTVIQYIADGEVIAKRVKIGRGWATYIRRSREY